MAKAREGDARAADIIKNWIRTRSTLEFLGTWEIINNSVFKVVEFDHFKMQAGLPSFVLSPGQWIENPMLSASMFNREDTEEPMRIRILLLNLEQQSALFSSYIL
jgi:hypothetical protein